MNENKRHGNSYTSSNIFFTSVVAHFENPRCATESNCVPNDSDLNIQAQWHLSQRFCMFYFNSCTIHSVWVLNVEPKSWKVFKESAALDSVLTKIFYLPPPRPKFFFLSPPRPVKKAPRPVSVSVINFIIWVYYLIFVKGQVSFIENYLSCNSVFRSHQSTL